MAIHHHEADEEAFLSFFQPGADLGDAALAYASLRLFVHPLKPQSKQPDSAHGWHDATTNVDQIKQWWRANHDRNIGVALRYSSVAVIDVDPRNSGHDTLHAAEKRHGPLPPTYTVRTAGGGQHFYYRVPADWYEENELPKILGPGLELLTNHYVVAPPSALNGNQLYKVSAGTIVEPFASLPQRWLAGVALDGQRTRIEAKWSPEDERWSIPKGERNETLTSIAGWARSKGANSQEIEDILFAFFDRIEDGHEVEDEIPTIARSVSRYPASEIRFADVKLTLKSKRKEPELSNVALRGPIGSFIRHIEPDTEAHPAALLAQSLAAFGNIVGAQDRGDIAPGFYVEDSQHRTALYVIIIGESAKSGKGDSWSRVKALMSRIDPTWARQAGVQTGEGLTDSLADDQELEEVTTINGEEVTHVRKGGNRDRRYFIVEPEFGRTLHASDRKGSTLKDVYRDLWDEGSTAKVTAGSKQTVSDATVSLVAHITKPELERDFDPVDLMSGFGNRFLHVFTRRTKVLPNARSLDRSELDHYAKPLKKALRFAREEAPDNYEFTDDAWEYWDDLCHELARKKPSPLVDALTARARPIIRRVAVIYAVAECCDEIHLCHLEAAHALWQYCERTVEHVFGSFLGDRDADKVYRALLEHPSGLTTTDISVGAFGRNASAGQIKRAVGILQERGLVNIRREKRGRKTVEIFMAKPQ